jgi:protein-tyrosine phosphatase
MFTASAEPVESDSPMIDIHTHILPEVDDGARTWEMAVQMCQAAAADGIEHMVATPHANDDYEYDRKIFLGLLDELSARIGPRPALSLGCDFHFSFDNVQKLRKEPEQFVIGSTGYLLVELSDFAVPPSITDTLVDLLQRGLTPIITHPERNSILLRKPERVLEWVRMGCAVQVTASALTGRWGRRGSEVAHFLLQHQAVHILATDCHNLEGRPPVLSAGRDAVAERYGAAVAEALVRTNPGAVIRGEELPYFPAVMDE